ncbi:transmembrane protein 107-like [Tachypleus tridentatus]|uniref:transmembrane protein 107-like n=1 Tax=Tachypleus tridentatus TaxID=6853 RepID=UPI003FD4613B
MTQLEYNSLIPSRFLIVSSHLLVLLTVFWSREENIKACLELSYSDENYKRKDTQFLVGVSLSLFFLLTEIIGFFGGMSIFCPSQDIFSIITHSLGTIAMSYFIAHSWDCDLFWWIFCFSSVMPGITEIIIIVKVLGMNKSI